MRYCPPQLSRDRLGQILAGFAYLDGIDSQMEVFAILLCNLSRTTVGWQYWDRRLHLFWSPTRRCVEATGEERLDAVWTAQSTHQRRAVAGFAPGDWSTRFETQPCVTYQRLAAIDFNFRGVTAR
jgi:hypothetical protein